MSTIPFSVLEFRDIRNCTSVKHGFHRHFSAKTASYAMNPSLLLSARQWQHGPLGNQQFMVDARESCQQLGNQNVKGRFQGQDIFLENDGNALSSAAINSTPAKWLYMANILTSGSPTHSVPRVIAHLRALD